MREFREIDDIEKKLLISERITPEEASEYVRKFDKSLEESKIEKEEVSSETEFERTKREIREYIDAQDKSEELIDEIISSISENPLKTDNLEIDHPKIRDGSREIQLQTPQIRENEFKEFNESLEEPRIEIVEIEHESETKRTLDQTELLTEIHSECLDEEYRDKLVRKCISKTSKALTNRELDSEEVHRLYYEEKGSQRRIAEVLGFSIHEIRKHFKTQRLKPRPVRKDIDPREIYRICVEEGRPKKEAAELLGCKSIKPINRILKENDWKTPLEVKMETEIDPDEVHRLHYDEGWAFIRIANHYGYESKDIICKLFDERDWIPTHIANRAVYEFPSEIEEEHRIEPSRTSDVFEHLENLEDVSPLDIARCIENLMSSSSFESRVKWVEVASQSKWATRATEVLSDNLNEVETSLNDLLSISEDSKMKIRVGFVDGKLYIRHQDKSEYNWINIYDNELFYFTSIDEKCKLIQETSARLGLSTYTDLGRLINQLTDRVSARGNGYSDIKGRQYEYMRAETLHLILDTTGQELSDVQEMIHRIGQNSGPTIEGEGGIRNPRFPTDPEAIDIMFAKFFGLGLSDGHISRTSNEFEYTEKNPDRREIVIQHSKDFGDVHYNEIEDDGEILQIRFASAFGRVLKRRGFTAGDRPMQNKGLPYFIRNGSQEIKYAYFSNLWPEDGSFNIEVRNNRGRFLWWCSVVLMDPIKEDEYGYITEITTEHLDLIQRFGTFKEERVKNAIGPSTELTAKTLDKLVLHNNPNISSVAQSLKDIVYRISCNRLFDEIDALGSIGVSATPYFEQLTFYKETSRLSAGWNGVIGKKIDVMRTALFMPPDDFAKKAKVEKWIQLNPDTRELVEREFFSKKKS